MTGSEVQLFSYALYVDKSILSKISDEFLSDDGKEVFRKLITGESSSLIETIPKLSDFPSEEKIIQDLIDDYIRSKLIYLATYIRSDMKKPVETIDVVSLLLDELKSKINVKKSSYDIMSHLNEFFESNKRDYIPLGIRRIDEKIYGMLRGNIFTIAGDTGSMKTTFTLWLSSNWARSGYKVLYFEKEMPADDVIRRLININCSISNQELLLGLYDKEKIEREMSQIRTLEVVPSTDFETVLDVYKIVERKKPDIFVIDFITQLDYGGQTASDFNYNLMRGLNVLKILTHKTNSVGVLISQLKKGTIESRSSKIARLDDLEWSAALKQLSAYVGVVFNPSMYYHNVDEDLFYLVFRKVRYGNLFYYPLGVNKELGQFFELDKERYKKAVSMFANF